VRNCGRIIKETANLKIQAAIYYTKVHLYHVHRKGVTFTVKPLFSVFQLKDIAHLVFNFNDLKLIIPKLNLTHLRLLSV
jgi:hypothetical protein